MNVLKITASAITFLLLVLDFLASRVNLVLLAGHRYCVLAWQIPFTNRFTSCPDWAWRASILFLPASILAILALWCAVVVKSWKLKQVSR
jgi:hypothetical protein